MPIKKASLEMRYSFPLETSALRIAANKKAEIAFECDSTLARNGDVLCILRNAVVRDANTPEWVVYGCDVRETEAGDIVQMWRLIVYLDDRSVEPRITIIDVNKDDTNKDIF